MSKHEMLPFKMVVERGRLVPAEAYDAERLDTWRNGTKVNVTFVRDGGRVMERKWWAILGRAVKECKTPWKTQAEASDAIKLAIGVVNLTKTVGGDFMAYPKSLTELDDPELDDAVRDMIDIVHHITGVDPEEWKKQVAHIRDEEPSSAPSTDDAGGADTASGGAVDPLSDSPPTDTAAADGAGDSEAADGQSAAPAPIDPVKRMLMEECIDNMLRDAFSEPAIDRPAKLDRLLDVFLQPENLGGHKDHEKFVRRCHETARRIIGKPNERENVKKYLRSKMPAGDAKELA